MIKETSKNLSTLVRESSRLVDERTPGVVAEVNNVIKTQIISLANEYNSLAERHSKLQADFSGLVEEYRKYRKSLDDAIGWNTLLQDPEKLPSDRIGSIFTYARHMYESGASKLFTCMIVE
jgi:hypothetical protein